MALTSLDVGVTPEEFAQLSPHPPVFSTEAQFYQFAAIQRYKSTSNTHTAPATRWHRFSLHLAGSMLVENTCDGRWVRHWSEGGESYIRPAGVPVTRSHKGRPDYLSVHINPSLVDRVAVEAFERDPSHMNLIERSGAKDPLLNQFGRLLLAEAETVQSSLRLMVETLITSISVQLLRGHSNLAQQEAPGLGAELSTARLRRCIDYMHAHLDDDLSLVRLAKVSDLSPSQFARAFRVATGEPPHRYVIRLRIERSCELLEHTQMPIIEIALRCGFEQPTHFATTFRKALGFTPRAWRVARRL